jgi:hypothetical protein
MKHWFNAGLMVIALLAATSSVVLASAGPESTPELPPGEKYRRLSLLLLVSAGVEPGLLELLGAPEQSDTDTMSSGSGDFAMQLDDYLTPLARIVDQESLLASAARMFRYARENGQQIQDELTDITQQYPILVSLVDVNEIAEDAIIIRNSIADAIAYSLAGKQSQEPEQLQAGEQAQPEQRLQTFRHQTIQLRNMMEYNIFQEELAQITDQAIIDLGGRLDAYQRMFDDEVDSELVQRRVNSAEIMNEQTGDNFDDQAQMRTKELLMMLILMESQVR